MNAATNNLREDRDWLKVSELSVGMQIAVPRAECFAAFGVGRPAADLAEVDAGDILWDEIEEIRELPEERVWDIEVEGTHNFVAGHLVKGKSDSAAKERPSRSGLDASGGVDAWFGGIFAHNTYLDGDLGIGTATPGAKLSILDQTSELRDVFSVATSTDNTIFRVDTAGDAFADGAFNSGGADYAEHFYADSADLLAGEVVCVSLENENAVARCVRPRDGNIMGIVSTNPAIVGNAGNIAAQQASAVVGMLGQVPAKVSNENGPIRPGDSLTSASMAGYAMKADPGDPTVGVALERLDADTGVVRVLISRRNKSLTVEQVEEAVVDRIAAMEIEDEVALLVSDAVSGYDFDPVVTEIIGGELALLEQDFDLRLADEIAALAALIEANKLELIEESAGLVAINTNLTVAGSLEAEGGILVPLASGVDGGAGLDALAQGDHAASGVEAAAAFRVSADGTVTAFNDFIISDGITATSVKETLAALSAETMVKTELTVRQDLFVGNSFEVMGPQVAGASVQRPVFKIALDGTISVREDLVLSGYTAWNDIPGIVSVFAYNTASDADGGAWVGGNRSASWYNEPIDAVAESCDLAVNDRCGLRSFPQQAIIAATADTVYLFDAKDGSLWKKIDRHAELVSASGSDAGPITALHAADGALYLAQDKTVSIVDFKEDKTQILKQVQDDGSGGLISSNTITDLHTQRINAKTYLAIAGDQGIDLINLADGSSRHAELVSVSGIRLTAAGDLYATATSTLSVFARAYSQDALAPNATYTASSTLAGLYITQDGNTAYTASGPDILKLTFNRHPDRAYSRAEGSMPVFTLDPSASLGVTDGGDVLGFSLDEQAQVIYAAYQGGVKALAMGDGSVLAEYASGEDSTGAPWSLSGATYVASLTGFGPTRQGELLSDTLVIATPNGLLAQSADVSARASLASGLSGFGSRARSGRLAVTDEALFSGRVRVTDGERLPLFAIDEVTGNTIVREDIIFSSDAAMQSVPDAASVFVYDTALDSDGGMWVQASTPPGSVEAASGVDAFGGLDAFPRQVIFTASNNTVHIYNSRTKELWGTYESSGIASIAGLAAKDGTLALYGEEGLVLVDLAAGTESAAQSVEAASGVEAALTAIAFSPDGDLYYAAADGVYRISGVDGEAGLVADAQSVHAASGVEAAITGIALSGSNLYISHEQGITKVNLATQETEDITISGEAGFAVHAAAITSISPASHNTLLIAYGDEVVEITEQGDIINTWTNEQARRDRNNLPYLANLVSSASASDGTYAIALQTPSGDSFVWMETQEQSLRDMLNAPRTVFTVIDRIQTPRIASVSSLSFTASSTISFYAGATSTPALVIRDSGDVEISGDVEVSGDISTSGNVGIGTGGYLKLDAKDAAPPQEDCAESAQYGRMSFAAQFDTLYLCGPNGWRAFEPAAAEEPVAENPVVEEPAATTTPEVL